MRACAIEQNTCEQTKINPEKLTPTLKQWGPNTFWLHSLVTEEDQKPLGPSVLVPKDIFYILWY